MIELPPGIELVSCVLWGIVGLCAGLGLSSLIRRWRKKR